MSFWKDPIKDVKNTAGHLIGEVSGKNERNRTAEAISESQARINADTAATQNVLLKINSEIDSKLTELAGDKAQIIKQAALLVLIVAIAVALLKIIV